MFISKVIILSFTETYIFKRPEEKSAEKRAIEWLFKEAKEHGEWAVPEIKGGKGFGSEGVLTQLQGCLLSWKSLRVLHLATKWSLISLQEYFHEVVGHQVQCRILRNEWNMKKESCKGRQSFWLFFFFWP